MSDQDKLDHDLRTCEQCDSPLWAPGQVAICQKCWNRVAAERDAVSGAMRQAIDALDEFAPYLYDGETPLERLKREITANDALTEKLAAVTTERDVAREALRRIIAYRQRVGPLGLQVEKLDDCLRVAAAALGQPTEPKS